MIDLFKQRQSECPILPHPGVRWDTNIFLLNGEKTIQNQIYLPSWLLENAKTLKPWHLSVLTRPFSSSKISHAPFSSQTGSKHFLYLLQSRETLYFQTLGRNQQVLALYQHKESAGAVSSGISVVSHLAPPVWAP